MENLLKGIKKNVPLKKYTTFKIGGSARYFFTAETKEDLAAAVLTAEKLKMPFFILGAGSNILVSDGGFDGLIIKIQITKYKIINTKIVAETGVKLGELLSISAKNGLTGLEWTVGIPGTLGGAIFGNAGAFNRSMGNIVDKIEAFDIKTKRIVFLNNKNCKFSYRGSIFKKNKGLIILSAELRLKKADKKLIKEKIKNFLKHRRISQPCELPSAGSVFANPDKFFAGKLVEKCGLKGRRIGGAEISKKHANFIINLGEARAQDVIKLINLAKKSVKKKFKINLKEEINYLGFKN